MATVFPAQLPDAILRDPKRDAERLVYDALRDKLGPKFKVFYSVCWLSRNAKRGAAEGEADFIIAHPELGVIVLEVKGGAIRRDGASGLWYSRSKANIEYEIKDPIAQARRSKHSLLDKLMSLPGHRWRSPRLSHAIAFPHCERVASLTWDCPPDLILCASDLGTVDRWVEGVFEYWDGEQEACTPLNDERMRDLQAVLAPTISVKETRTLLGSSLSDADKEIARLTRQQANVLRGLNLNRRVSVTGGAGTGKTTLALGKARLLASEGFRTLLTCYNRPLADHLMHCAQGQNDLVVMDFHQLCAQWSKAAGLKPTRYPSDPDYWSEELPALFVESITCPSNRRFDAIVVDEGQDFSESWFVALQLALSDTEGGILYIFSDDNQRIYRPRNTFRSEFVSLALYENLRNAKPIHKVAAGFYRGNELQASGPDGPQVEFIEAKDGDAQERVLSKILHRLIREEKVSASNIAVLTGRSVETAVCGRKGAFGTFGWTRDVREHSDRVLFESIARFKGLERQVVVLCEIDDLVASSREESLYVGLSRARGHLVVVGSSATLSGIRAEQVLKESASPDQERYLRILMGGDSD